MKKYALMPILLLAVVFAGCENAIYRTVYNSLDTIVYRAVSRYIQPNREQERAIRESIESFFRWHRRVELRNYATTMRGLATRMAAGMGGPDLAWLRGRFERHLADIFNAASDDAAAILVSLEGKQIDRLERTLVEREGEMEKALHAPGRARESGRSAVRFIEYIYGPLTGRQIEDIVKGAGLMEDIEERRIRMYRERRGEFIALLRAGADAGAVKTFLARMALGREDSYPDYYREAAARRDRAAAEGFLLFNREIATPEQRAHAVARIRGLADLLEEL